MPREFSPLAHGFQTIEVSERAMENDNMRYVAVKIPALGGRPDLTI